MTIGIDGFFRTQESPDPKQKPRLRTGADESGLSRLPWRHEMAFLYRHNWYKSRAKAIRCWTWCAPSKPPAAGPWHMEIVQHTVESLD